MGERNHHLNALVKLMSSCVLVGGMKQKRSMEDGIRIPVFQVKEFVTVLTIARIEATNKIAMLLKRQMMMKMMNPTKMILTQMKKERKYLMILTKTRKTISR